MYNPLIGTVPMPVIGSPDVNRPQANPAARFDNSAASFAVDGTPVRVVTIALASAISLMALRWAGFRFNVGVSV